MKPNAKPKDDHAHDDACRVSVVTLPTGTVSTQAFCSDGILRGSLRSPNRKPRTFGNRGSVPADRPSRIK